MKKIAIKKFLLLSSADFIEGKEVQALGFIDWIAGQKLHGKDSRVRTKLLKIFIEKAEEIEADRKKLVEEFAEKDKEGKILYIGKDGKDTTEFSGNVNYKLSEDSQAKFNKEYEEMMKEDCIVDIVPSNKELVWRTRDILLKTEETFVGKEAAFYDEWCDAFENPIEVKD